MLNNPVSSGRVDGCSVCGTSLEFLYDKELLSCYFCGEQKSANVWCPEGHYICDSCFEMPLVEFIKSTVKCSRSKSPFDLATIMMGYPQLDQGDPCGHAMIFTASALTAIKNEGTIRITDYDIFEALYVIKGDIDSGSGVPIESCDMVSGVKVAFNTVFKTLSGNKTPDEMTMKVVTRALDHLSGASAQNGCLKNVVLTTLELITPLLRARFGIKLEGSSQNVICYHIGSSPQCNPATCQYSPLTNAR